MQSLIDWKVVYSSAFDDARGAGSVLKQFSCFLCLLFIGLTALPALSCAAERLRFNAPQASFKQILLSENTALTADLVAKADLNEDGLDEYIVKRTGTEAAHNFVIYALSTDNTLTPLGAIQGKTLALGNHYHHGIRDILVFKDAANDFSYDSYVWNPQHSKYMIATRKE